MAKQQKNTNNNGNRNTPAPKPVNPAPVPAKKAAEAEKKPIIPAGPKEFGIKYPLLWLMGCVLVVYFVSFHFGFTELDDSIFIREMHEYNEDISNLITSFHRGVFNPTGDTYYRPLFLDSIILNYRYSELEPMGYHIMNVIFHLISVGLLYNLFKKLNIKPLHSFILSLVFAVHPVISQAVAWIPGRNDTMLAVFTLSFLISSINYSNKGKISWLLLSALFLLLALFTKETAVFDAPVAFMLLIVYLKKNWLDKKNIAQYVVWIAAFFTWFGVRSTATLKTNNLAAGSMLHDFIGRCPVLVQYLGKIFFPFNLSVFPIQQDTVYYYGFAAVIALAVILAFAKNKDWRKTLTGFAVFLLFLLPVLFVPNALNEQTFEHRLYLPIIGILLLMPQTVLLQNKLKDKQLLAGWGVAIVALGIINVIHQQNFNDPIAFWGQAQRTSPHSAYATMMYAARTKDRPLMRRAYALNPNEKYINYYYGVMLQDEDSILQSEPYLLKEKKISNYYECDFYLARVAFEKKDLPAAGGYLEAYIQHDPANDKANSNLLLIYLQTGQKDKAIKQVRHMQDVGLSVPSPVLSQLGIH